MISFFFHILLSLNCFSYIGKKARFINITHINFSCSCWWARLIGCCVYPAAHTPDNSFLGFVVEQHLNASDVKHIDDIKRQNQSLVYGKVDNFWKVSSARNQSLTTFFLGCLHVKPCCVYTLDCFATFSLRAKETLRANKSVFNSTAMTSSFPSTRPRPVPPFRCSYRERFSAHLDPKRPVWWETQMRN